MFYPLGPELGNSELPEPCTPTPNASFKQDRFELLVCSVPMFLGQQAGCNKLPERIVDKRSRLSVLRVDRWAARPIPSVSAFDEQKAIRSDVINSKEVGFNRLSFEPQAMPIPQSPVMLDHVFIRVM
jgi:hypothetical protein